MIKCPNCGSTAQVKVIEELNRVGNRKRPEYYDTTYKCECGCGKKFAYFDQRHQGYVRNGWEGYEKLKEYEEGLSKIKIYI